MLISKLLTNYLLASPKAKIFISIMIYYILLIIITYDCNSYVLCSDTIETNDKKTTMVFIEQDRLKEYENIIQKQNQIIKQQNQILQEKKLENNVLISVYESQLILIGAGLIVVALKFITKYLGY